MNDRLKKLGYVLVVIGLVFVVAAGVGFFQTQNGYESLQKFSEAQGVELSYNDDGQLVDRGTVEGAQGILDLLENDWGYTIVAGELNPNDPLVNTASEYMYQMATVTYHTLNGTQTVVLDEPAEYNGETFEAGTYEVPVDGRYWSDFDRSHPLDGLAREQAWSGTAHGIVGELGVGTVTHSALKLALAMSGLFAGVGLVTIIAGSGLVWATSGASKREFSLATEQVLDKELSTSGV
jgi:hypothetical protein